ncbi:MAG: acyl-CoA dehydrogenase family protein [Polyangiaceae bacterium]
MSHADPSAGWSLLIGALSSAMLGAFLGEGAVREVFRGRVPVSAGLQVPMGRAVKVDGGFEVSGRWGFGSGIRHAEWVVAPAFIDTGAPPEGMPAMMMAVLPAGRVTVEHTWETTLLRGSGSDHYRVEGARVEDAFVVPYPAAPRLRGGVWFELPFVALVSPVHMAFALGVAQRALDEVAEVAAPRRIRAWSQRLLREDGAFRVRFGRMSAALSAARAMAREVTGEMTLRVERGGVLDARDWARVRTAVTYVTETAAEVATFALRAGGASALGPKSVTERCFRDAHAALLHVAASEEAYDFATGARLGEEAFYPMHLPRPRAA